jgi:hypothetical protein
MSLSWSKRILINMKQQSWYIKNINTSERFVIQSRCPMAGIPGRLPWLTTGVAFLGSFHSLANALFTGHRTIPIIQSDLLRAKHQQPNKQRRTVKCTYYSNTMYSIPSELYVSSSSTMCGCFNMWHMVASRFKSETTSKHFASVDKFRLNK